MERERVTVIENGVVRLYEANGHGLVEFATIRADLTAEDAARLAANLVEFLATADRTKAPLRAAAVTAASLRPTGAKSGRAPVLGQTVVTYLATHPGETSPAIGRALNLTTKQASNALTALKSKGHVTTTDRRWYLTDQAPDTPALVVAKRGDKSARTRPPHELAAMEATIIRYVREHPGAYRSVVADALGLDHVTFGNRIAALVTRGAIRQEQPDPIKRTKVLFLTSESATG